MKRLIRENQGCYNCKKHNEKSCNVYKETNTRPDDYDWCYGYIKRKD